MIRYIVARLSERSNHPLLLSLCLLAAGFTFAGIVAGQLFGRELVAGFMMIYAIIAAFLSIGGYVSLIVGSTLSNLRYRYEFTD